MVSNEGTADTPEPEGDDRLGPVRSLRLRPGDDEKILRLAARDDRPVGYVLRKLVEKSLDEVAA